MASNADQPINPAEITPLDIDRAYRLSGLRKDGIGFIKAIETHSIYIALRGTARAMKRKQQRTGVSA